MVVWSGIPTKWKVNYQDSQSSLKILGRLRLISSGVTFQLISHKVVYGTHLDKNISEEEKKY